MGCSFTYGNGLNYNEIFSTQLSDYIHHPVYNLGLDGACIKESLYIMRHPEILNQLVQNKNQINYVIYTFIDQHFQRLYSDMCRKPEPNFTADKNYTYLKYKETKFSFYRSLTYYYINNYFAFSINYNPVKLFNLYVKELNREIKKQFKNNNKETKLVLLIYRNDNNLIEQGFDELKQNGIIVIDIKNLVKEDLTNLEYTTNDKFHPNAKAWQVIVPALAKELNL